MEKQENKGALKKTIITAGIAVLIIAIILGLTFLHPDISWNMSEAVRLWMNDHGMQVDAGFIRSNIHIPMYFVLGIALGLLASSRTGIWKQGRRFWIAAAIGCGIGILDEVVKIWLPKKEFDVGDLWKDFVGVAAGVAVVWIVTKRKNTNA